MLCIRRYLGHSMSDLRDLGAVVFVKVKATPTITKSDSVLVSIKDQSDPRQEASVHVSFLFDLPIDCDIFLDRHLSISYSWLSVLSRDHIILSFVCLYCYLL